MRCGHHTAQTFSRAHSDTTSTPSKAKPWLALSPVPSLPGTDDFGRTRTHSLPYPAAAVPLSAPPTASSPIQQAQVGGVPPPRAAYGLLSSARDAVLGLPDAARLVARVCAELERTGVATPFVFSALDVRRAAVAPLVHAFLATCADGARGGKVG
ncbi:hypothetical protein DFH09DRAFT_1433557 [Mycena vulgaris]|nr:hypothetical protein DFH09DRAFT_1433557 [Mycena vulgaris]